MLELSYPNSEELAPTDSPSGSMGGYENGEGGANHQRAWQSPPGQWSISHCLSCQSEALGAPTFEARGCRSWDPRGTPHSDRFLKNQTNRETGPWGPRSPLQTLSGPLPPTVGAEALNLHPGRPGVLTQWLSPFLASVPWQRNQSSSERICPENQTILTVLDCSERNLWNLSW